MGRGTGRGDVDSGIGGLVGLLAVLVILGLTVGIVLATQGGNPDRLPGSLPVTLIPGSGAVPPAGSLIDQAAVAACREDYLAAQTAVEVYQVEHGTLPTSTAQIKGMLRAPLGSRSFSITIDPHRPGTLQVVAGSHPAVDGEGNCAYAR